MKNKMRNLTKDQIQRIVFISLLVLVFAAFFISLSIATSDKNPIDKDPIENPDDKDPIDNPDDKDPIDNPDDKDPVVVAETLGLPLAGSFEVVRKYYDATGSQESQELAVIQFGKRYYTSTGVALISTASTSFNVIATMSGEIMGVEESPIYGITVTIKHNNDIYTEYSSLSYASVAVGDEVAKGAVIGVSGVCEFDNTLASHVYFKLVKENTNYNPESYFGKDLSKDLQ